jgi:mannose-1-phosphate guanylyltransferase
MAGGVGSRFWPMSRSTFPKQFIDVLGVGKTLLQQTYLRFLKTCPKENIYVVTNDSYIKLVKEQLPDLADKQVLGEPQRRNTAPCIAYASYKIGKENPDANIVVAPSDHVIMDSAEFDACISQAMNFTAHRDCLVTLGIKPSRPDTGYGYIQFMEDAGASETNLCKVKTFTEKPDLDMAKFFLQSGEFLWNSGIFIWNFKSILKAFEEFLPEMHTLFTGGNQNYNTASEVEFIKKAYALCTNISIDIGILEKAQNVYVLPADFGWSDLGTWGSLYDHIQKDVHQNAVVGNNVMLYESTNCVVNVPKNKLVVLQGLDDYIVVESDSILLVCKKQDEQQIRQFVSDVKLAKGEKFV